MLFILLISLFVYEYVLMLKIFFGYSHCVSITFVGVGFSYDLRLVRVDRPHVPMWSQMLTAYSAQGSTHVSWRFIYVKDIIGSIGYLISQHFNFCKRNVRTPAWVYNVIMSAWIIVRLGTLDVVIRGVPFIEGFLSSGCRPDKLLADFPWVFPSTGFLQSGGRCSGGLIHSVTF